MLREQFTQTDPLPSDDDVPYVGSYVYGNDNPVVFTDPSGLRAKAGRSQVERIRANTIRYPERNGQGSGGGSLLAGIGAARKGRPGPKPYTRTSAFLTGTKASDGAVDQIAAQASGYASNKRAPIVYWFDVRLDGVSVLLNLPSAAVSRGEWSYLEPFDSETGVWTVNAWTRFFNYSGGSSASAVLKVDSCRPPYRVLEPRVQISPETNEEKERKRNTGGVLDGGVTTGGVLNGPVVT